MDVDPRHPCSGPHCSDPIHDTVTRALAATVVASVRPAPGPRIDRAPEPWLDPALADAVRRAGRRLLRAGVRLVGPLAPSRRRPTRPTPVAAPPPPPRLRPDARAALARRAGVSPRIALPSGPTGRQPHGR